MMRLWSRRWPKTEKCSPTLILLKQEKTWKLLVERTPLSPKRWWSLTQANRAFSQPSLRRKEWRCQELPRDVFMKILMRFFLLAFRDQWLALELLWKYFDVGKYFSKTHLRNDKYQALRRKYSEPVDLFLWTENIVHFISIVSRIKLQINVLLIQYYFSFQWIH